MKRKYVIYVAGAIMIFLAGCEDKKNAGVSAVDDSAVVQSGMSVNIDVLANDGEYTSSKTIKGWTQGTHGSTVKENNNTITYTPNNGYVGRDSFNYILKVDQYESRGEVNVTITDPAAPDNAAPTVSAGDDKTVQVDESIDINGTDRDSDGSIRERSWKEGSDELSREQSFVYTPTAVGQHKLVYTVTDDDGASASDEMNVTVTEAPASNSKPVANAASITMADGCEIGTVVSFTLTGGDADGDTLTFSKVTGSSYGSVVLEGDGQGEFKLDDSEDQNKCFDGMANSFTFKVHDGTEYSEDATVTIDAPQP